MISKKEIVIDSHSHLGYCNGWAEATLPEYLELMEKEGVDIAFLFPVPYELDFETKKELYLNWQYTDGKTEFSSSILPNVKNPYRVINSHISEIVRSYSGEKELYFIPMIHPYLDTASQIREYKEKYNPVAFKIHGTGSGIEPQRIPLDIIRELKKCDIPLILHTAYSRSVVDDILRNNSPSSWAKWLINNDLKGCLAHGARLDREALNLANKYDNITLGIAPCDRVSRNTDRLASELESYTPLTYLTYLSDYVDYRKILFDLDYSWNREYLTNIPIFNTAELVKKVFKEKAKDVFSGNCIHFFSQLKKQSFLLSKYWVGD